MAKRIVTELIDDLDGTPDAKTVPFSFDGVNYEIELSEANQKEFRKALEPYISKGRKVSTPTTPASPRRTASPARKEELQAIRDWARANGHKVSDRGRIAASIVEEYKKAK